MAKKHIEADMDLVEGLPEDTETQTENNYVPATRQGMGVMAPSDAVVLDMDGVRPPWLKLVHGTSKKAIEAGFDLGDLVLKDTYRVAKKGERLQAIFVVIDQYFKVREFVEGQRAVTFKTLEAAAAAGYNTKWDDAQGLKPEVSRAMDIIMLIRRNKDANDALFGVPLGIEDEGQPTEWGWALLSLDKTNYRLFMNDIGITVNNRLKKTGLYSGLWELNSEMAPASPYTSNRPFVIRARFKGMLDAHVIENIKSSMGVPVSEKDEDGNVDFP